MITEIAATINQLFSVIDKLIPDKEKAEEAKAKLIELQQNGELKIIEQQANTITAEIKSDSWINKNWRALAALSFIFIIVNNYVLAPYLKAFGFPFVMLDIPPNMWELLNIMIGGYIFHKGIEKWKR